VGLGFLLGCGETTSTTDQRDQATSIVQPVIDNVQTALSDATQPVTTLASTRKAQSPSDHKWSPDDIPEAIVIDFRQEDLKEDAITTWTARGVKSITATGHATKLPGMEGVRFSAVGSQRLSWNRDHTALWLNRWWLVIARADQQGVTGTIPVMTVNGANRAKIHLCRLGLSFERASCRPRANL
jgi:hypothetical protein